MVNLRRRLASHALVGLDTSAWIYHLEGNERYLSLTTEILNSVQSGRPRGMISVMTIMELTVRPYRLNKPEIAARYEALLSRFPNLITVDTTQAIARRAAQLRGIYSLKAVDAILVATSLIAGATAWITNDHDLRRLAPFIDVIILDDILEARE